MREGRLTISSPMAAPAPESPGRVAGRHSVQRQVRPGTTSRAPLSPRKILRALPLDTGQLGMFSELNELRRIAFGQQNIEVSIVEIRSPLLSVTPTLLPCMSRFPEQASHSQKRVAHSPSSVSRKGRIGSY